MKKMIVVLLGICSLLFAGNVGEMIQLAEAAANAGNLEQAAEIMKRATETDTNSADAFAYYGLYLSKLAGQAGPLKATVLSEKSFKQFKIALELEPGHVNATLYRGILSVNLPKFFGKLEQGIADLEFIQNRYGQNQQLYMVSSYYLGIGTRKNGEEEKAKAYFKFVVLYGKDTQFYADAKAQLEELSTESTQEESGNNYQKAMQFLEENQLKEAVYHFRLAARQDTTNLELYLIYARTLGALAGQGYDETIGEDVTARAVIAHEVFEVLSRCVELAPGNDEILLLRGSVAINLPFFVNSLDTGIEDMTYLSQNGKTDEIKGQASYLLKEGLEKKRIYKLAETGYNAATEEEKQQLLTQFIPTQSPIEQEQPQGDHLQIELVLGYRDQIAPQTAVWIEDETGNYLKTIYISGFAAHVKEQQIHLPRWAESSEFRQLDAVTGASIDCGKHILYWDFTDFAGNKVSGKKFVLRTEICHWPHVQYHNQSLEIDLAKSDQFQITETNFLIPELKATWISH
ncbi:MAG: DUF2271 domain-containing protein [Candidatus Cloacimonadales bacterium]|nr:DUF2271 domain-containing protein [Candidatus Cloacimonadales bacterium]